MEVSLDKLRTSFSNISPSIGDKLGKAKHNQQNHPVEIIKRKIYQYPPFESFQKFDDLSPIVNTKNNFDRLLIPVNHSARSKSDTYYVSEDLVLRTHTSAHESELLEKGHRNFLVTGDVYRKDEIDSSHYPVFHQMEGVGLVKNVENAQEELLDILVGLVKFLFPNCKHRVNPDYFPFTEPSFEIEVKYKQNLPDEDESAWMEVLGCGVLQQKIIENVGLTEKFWAFGLGLERLAMVMFEIPDIRYFWSDHPKFLDQFSEGKIVKFQEYSLLPSQFNDISFWIPSEQVRELTEDSAKMGEEDKWINANDFYDFVRDIGGDWIEKVELKDEFFHPKKKMLSRMYRVTYSPKDPSLKDPGEFTKIVLEIQDNVREQVEKNLKVTLR